MGRAGREKRPTDTRLLAALLIAGACVTVFSAVMLAAGLRPYREARREYDVLRRVYAPDTVSLTAAPAVIPTAAAPAQIAPGPAEINPDYVGWLQIAGTAIDYPVVQGWDNNQYLTKTFEGRENKAGAIFMDYRCTDGFDALHAIVYGHNMQDGSMFGTLARYLEDGYLEQNPEITVTLTDGAVRTYRIFAVRETDSTDPAYRLDFTDEAELAAALGAPEGTAGLLTLSTCGDGGGEYHNPCCLFWCLYWRKIHPKAHHFDTVGKPLTVTLSMHNLGRLETLWAAAVKIVIDTLTWLSIPSMQMGRFLHCPQQDKLINI